LSWFAGQTLTTVADVLAASKSSELQMQILPVGILPENNWLF